MAHRSPRPFSIGVPVRASRDRAGSRRSCWAVSLAGFLMAWASSSTMRPHSTAASASTSRTAVAYVVITMSAPAMAPCSCSAVGLDAPWCTSTRRPGTKRAASAAQLPTTAAGAMTRAVPELGRAGQLGEHRRRLAEPHVEGQAPAELGGVEEADPAQGVGLVRAQLPDEALGSGDRRRRRRAGAAQDVGGPAVAADVDAAAQPRAAEPDALAEDLGPGELRRLLALGQRGRGLLEVDPVELDPAPRGTGSAAGPDGPAGRRRRPTARRRRTARTTTRCSAGGHRPPIRPASRRRGAATASPCAGTASARGRRSRPWRGPGRHRVIRSHASSWLSATWPRRCVADRLSTGERRPSRIHSAATGRPSRSVRSAASTGIGAPLPDGTCTDSSHTPPASGASSWTMSRGRDVDVTVRVQLVEHPGDVAGQGDGRRERRAVHAGDDGVAHVAGRAHRRAARPGAPGARRSRRRSPRRRRR